MPRVRFRSGAPQTHYSTATTKKTCKCRPFPKRLKGFEPSTFCMASSTRTSRPAPNNAANKPFSAPTRARGNTRHSPGDHGGFRTQTGPSLVVPEPLGGSQACAQETDQSAALSQQQEPPSTLLLFVPCGRWTSGDGAVARVGEAGQGTCFWPITGWSTCDGRDPRSRRRCTSTNR